MDSGSGFSNGFIFSQINGFIFEGSPEPLDKHVVQGSAPTVHAYLHSPVCQRLYPPTAGELGSLISVKNLSGRFFDMEGAIKSLHAERDVQRRRQGPR